MPLSATLLVLPLACISLLNLFVAGPPLKTIVFESIGASYGVSLPFLRLRVARSSTRFVLSPKNEITHFFVITCQTNSFASLAFDAVVRGCNRNEERAVKVSWQPLAHVIGPPKRAKAAGAPVVVKQWSTLQLLQPLLGYSHYDILLRILPSTHTPVGVPASLSGVEYRLTYGVLAEKYAIVQISSALTHVIAHRGRSS